MSAAVRCLSLLGLQSASGAGAQRQRGSFPAFLWADDPPAGVPFGASDLFSPGLEMSGTYAAYGRADTWYPAWAGDGNMYTPFTDGSVTATDGGSAARANSAQARPGALTTTGFATVVGDDPLDLQVVDVGVYGSLTGPYKGRYPCGSFVKNGTWFYGTYALDNEDHEPGLAAGAGTRAYCGNWCIQGPFVGFRWSVDQGRSWVEPRRNLSGWGDSLFGEAAPGNHSKVKFGAPHIVDFGQEIQHSPDGKVYLVGHGASDPYSPQSWMQGSEVYLARVEPTVDSVQDGAQWEFYAGHGQWVRGDVGAARPILSWANRTGVVTMTYVPALKRYLTCISTPTFSPFTTRQFDTYLLESEAMTGPFRRLVYLREFGPEAYFVNIPSKFLGADVAEDGSFSFYLSYSANFAFRSDASPAGSGYHWTLQKVRLVAGNATYVV